MKILILNQAFFPDVASTAQHAGDLAVALTRTGHDVLVVCNSRGYDDPKLHFPRHELWNGIRIIRLWSTGFGKKSRWRRALDFGTFMASVVLRLCFLPQVDVIVAMTSPPLVSFIAALAVPRKARRLVFWSMDLNPDEAIAAGWLREKSVIARVLSWMLLYSLQRADRIVALDRFMKDRIQAKGVNAQKILVVPPWSHDDRVSFDPLGREDFRRVHKLSSKFVVMYSGNHSPCHPLDTLLEAALRLANRDEVAFCFIGGGSEFRNVQERVKRRGMRNVLCLPYQPIEKLSASLSAADLHVVVMGEKYVGIVHPCKVYNILAANRPLLCIGPKESHINDIITQAGVRAFVVSNGDVDSVVTNVLETMQARGILSLFFPELCKRYSKNCLIPQMIGVIEGSQNKSLGLWDPSSLRSAHGQSCQS